MSSLPEPMQFDALVEFLRTGDPRPGRFVGFDLRWTGSNEPEYVFFDAPSFRAALHSIGADYLAALRDAQADDLAALAHESHPAELAELPDALRTFCLLALGEVSGPYSTVSRPGVDPYVGRVPLLYELGARVVCAFSAAPPNQDSAFGVLELQPEALVHAGYSALHRAVADEDVSAARAELQRGADPNLFADFGNAPIFAARDGDAIRPRGAPLTSGARLTIARLLAEAGLSREVESPAGETVLDLAIAGDDDALTWALEAGFRRRRFGAPTLGRLLASLPYGDVDRLRRRLREVRCALMLGADPNERTACFERSRRETPLRWFFDTTYYDHEISGEILAGFVRALLDAGAIDQPDDEGRTALERARACVARGQANYGQTVGLLESRA